MVIAWDPNGAENTVSDYIWQFYNSHSFSDMKEIIPFNLVRMGLAKAKGNGIFKSAKFGVSFTLLNEEELKDYHTELVTLLREQPYGPFVAMTSMLGVEMAQSLSSSGQVTKRPMTKRKTMESSGNEAGPSKRSNF